MRHNGLGDAAQKLPFPKGDLGPLVIHGLLGTPKSTPQTASRLVQQFGHR